MITTPQIFIIFEPGLYGTFLATIFARHRLCKNYFALESEFESDKNGFNSHGAGYEPLLKRFHSQQDYEWMKSQNSVELETHLCKLEKYKLGIHTHASYHYLDFDHIKYFTNFVRILLKPKEDRLENYAKRFRETHPVDNKNEYWTRYIKNLTKLPFWFREKMTLQEKTKYLKDRFTLIKDYQSTNNYIVFDPDDIKNHTLLQNLIDRTCQLLQIQKISLPTNSINNFLEKNQKFL